MKFFSICLKAKNLLRSSYKLLRLDCQFLDMDIGVWVSKPSCAIDKGIALIARLVLSAICGNYVDLCSIKA